MKKAKSRPIRTPDALKKQLKVAEAMKGYQELTDLRRKHRLMEHRSNVQNELHRLQGAANEILPGLREHLTRRAGQLQAANRLLRR